MPVNEKFLTSILYRFRDVTKACPKHEFFANMVMLVDASTGHEMFSFMDGFSGYSK